MEKTERQTLNDAERGAAKRIADHISAVTIDAHPEFAEIMPAEHAPSSAA